MEDKLKYFLSRIILLMTVRLKDLYIETEKSRDLKRIIRDVASERKADYLLLGGTDSAILGWAKPLPAYTVVIENSGEDKIYSEKVAKILGLKWELIEISQEKAMDTLKALVKVNKSYDLALMNDIAPYVAMEHAVEKGAKIIRSGQDPEMIFQGYEHLTKYDNVIVEIDKLTAGYYRQPLDVLEGHFSIKIDRPYLDPRILNFARNLSRIDNVVDNTPIYGSYVQEMYKMERRITKLTLRRTMVGILPIELTFRPMSDLVYGSGTYKLEDALIKTSGPERLEEINSKDKPVFRDKAHHGMYVLFRESGLNIIPPKENQYSCLSCGGGVQKETAHCYTCGADPALTPLWNITYIKRNQ